jgi:hypothetical protein
MQGVCAWKLRERRSDYCDQAHSCDRIICQKYVQTAESTVATINTARLLRARKLGRPAEMVGLERKARKRAATSHGQTKTISNFIRLQLDGDRAPNAARHIVCSQPRFENRGRERS